MSDSDDDFKDLFDDFNEEDGDSGFVMSANLREMSGVPDQAAVRSAPAAGTVQWTAPSHSGLMNSGTVDGNANNWSNNLPMPANTAAAPGKIDWGALPK